MKKIVMAVLVFVLSSCAHGVRYQEPSPSQDTAIFETTKDASLLTFSDSGCVDSYSMSSGEMRIEANKEIFVRYAKKYVAQHYCSILFSFKSKKGAKYQVSQSLELSEDEKKSWSPSAIGGTCHVTVTEIDTDGTRSNIPLKTLEWKKTLNICERAR